MTEAGNEKLEISTGLNFQTAQYLNNKHKQIAIGTRQLIDIALDIGQALNECQKNDGFVEWLKANVSFSHQTAYKYISLFNYKEQSTGAGNLTEAYKLIETLEAQKKQTEAQKASRRVAEYRKTGKKPEGWRQHTDDKLAQEEEERDKRIEEAFQKKRDEAEAKQRQEVERVRLEAETDTTLQFLNKVAEAVKKRAQFKEAIRLSADGMEDPFQDALIDYLETLENDNRRIEACHNIIKICKRITSELQAKSVKGGAV
jgi:hypothetical protein